MIILNSIGPIFLLIALGAGVKRVGFLTESFFKQVNLLVYWIALPALLISRISTAHFEAGVFLQIVLLFSLGTFCSLVLAWIVSAKIALPRVTRGAFIQGAFRGNGAFVALPIILYIVSDIDPAAADLATLTLAPVVILFNILGVVVLIHYSDSPANGARPGSILFQQMVKNPLLGACALGLALNLLQAPLPLLVHRTLSALGQAALPLVLMSIGAGLAFDRLKGAASPTLWASLIKVVLTPACGLAFAKWFNLSQTEAMIAICYLAAPAAGMSYVMADVLNSDALLAGRIIVLSTLLSAITLPVIIAIGL